MWMDGTFVDAFVHCNFGIILDSKEDYLVKSEKSRLVDIPIQVYKRRWLVLFVFCFLSLTNNMTNFTYSPIANLIQDYYQIDSIRLNMLTVVFFVSGMTVRWIAMWIIDNVGLGPGVVIASLLNVFGSWLRLIPGSYQDGYWYALIGQSVCAIGTAFVDIAAPKLAANWFPPHQRTTATAIGSCPLFLSLLLSYTVGPLVVTESNGGQIWNYILVTAFCSTASAALALCFFRGKPPCPPSVSQLKNVEKTDFRKGLMQIWNFNFTMIFGVFCFAGGGAVAFSALLNQIATHAGYTSKEAGLFGSVWVGAAIFAAAVSGPFVDGTRRYKQMILAAVGPAVVLAVFFSLYMSETFHKSVPIVSALCAGLGLAGGGIPAILEAAIEVAYPIPEATVMGVLFLGLNLFSAFFILILGEVHGKDGNMGFATWVLVATSSLSIIFLVLFKEDYRRLAFENGGDEVKVEEVKLSKEPAPLNP